MNIIDTKGKKGYNPKERFKVVETKPLTNYDRLISKTPEELAEWFCRVQFRAGDVCPPEHGWTLCQYAEGCKDCWLSWLKSPVEEVQDG